MDITFLKLGGSLITVKDEPLTARHDVIERIAGEIATALNHKPDLRLVVGHGSGSFGHSAGKRHGTREGVRTAQQWRGFAEVGLVAAQLNQIVGEALAEAGIPVFRVAPSALVSCVDGAIIRMHLAPIRAALEAGLIPLVYGDVAFDMNQGGTIVSTEDVFTFMAGELFPKRILLAGAYAGVYGNDGQVIPRITLDNFDEIRSALGASESPDVTGGMESKVIAILDLCDTIRGTHAYVFSGEKVGAIQAALIGSTIEGTHISG